MTKQEAIAKYETGWYKGKTAEEVVRFQLFEPRLCMPWAEFHAAVEKALGRPVMSHEFAFYEDLQAEFRNKHPWNG